MKLYDVYKHKKNNNIIQVQSFATHMNRYDGDMIIVFSNIEKHNEYEAGFCPSDNGYGTEDEILKEYDLFIPQSELDKYGDWNEILNLVSE